MGQTKGDASARSIWGKGCGRQWQGPLPRRKLSPPQEWRGAWPGGAPTRLDGVPTQWKAWEAGSKDGFTGLLSSFGSLQGFF